MEQSQPDKDHTSVIVSESYAGDTLVETVFDPEERVTALLIANGTSIDRVTEWEHAGVRLRPVDGIRSLYENRDPEFMEI